MPTRRGFLTIALAALALATTSRTARATLEVPRGRRAPRYLASILLSGGVDAITTTDPKTRDEVEPWVDVPYGGAAIVHAGGLRLGPHLASFARLAPRLAILNGVALRTANHSTGTEQFLRMRTGTRPTMPTLLSVLGQRRDSQAIGCLGWSFGSPQLLHVLDEPPDDLRRMAHVLRGQAGALLDHHHEPGSRRTQEDVLSAARLLERAADAEPLAYEAWSDDEGAQSGARALQRVLWAFENDLTRCFEVNLGGQDQPWDTQTFNAERQSAQARKLEVVARFLSELGTRKLVDRTLVVVGSELGRFPALNGQHGKDHFPEAPLLLYGAGIRGGASHGRTGRRMEALPVSLATGKDEAGGHMVTLDDVGATLLAVAGVQDPRVLGYEGRILDFLVDA